MEFKIKQSVLKDALAAVQGALEKKGTMPILSHVMIESLGENNIQVTATDLDVTIRHTTGADIVQAGSICVLARKLFELARNLSESDLSIKSESNHWITLRSGKSTFKIAGVERGQFPEIATNKSTPVKIKLSLLSEFIARTSFAIDRNRGTRVPQGVKLTVSDGKILMAGCDGARVAEMTAKIDGGDGVDVIVPVRALPLIATLTGETAFIGADQHHIFVQTEDTLIVARRLTGNFPNYQLIMPNGERRLPCRVDLEAFRSVIKRAALMSDERNESFRMTMSEGQIVISAKSSEATDANEILDAEYDGPEQVYGFQWPHLIDYLTALGKTEHLSIWVTAEEEDPNGRSKPIEMLGEGVDGYRFVVAPLNLAVAKV